jgi:hypothetical protein
MSLLLIQIACASGGRVRLRYLRPPAKGCAPE